MKTKIRDLWWDIEDWMVEYAPALVIIGVFVVLSAVFFIAVDGPLLDASDGYTVTVECPSPSTTVEG